MVPVGTVMAYAGNIDDKDALPGVSPKQNAKAALTLLSRGWAYCNGQAIDKGYYNELYQIIGDTYGSDDDNFNLPDYRGYFFRAVDNGAGRDTEKREKSAGGNSTGVGTTQLDQFQGHEHDYQGGETEAAIPAEQGADAVMLETLPTTNVVEMEGMGKPRYGKETRPINISVNYIIKIQTVLDHPALS